MFDPSEHYAHEEQQSQSRARQVSPNNATQPRTTHPWSRWETPLLILAVGFTLLLWLLQAGGSHTAWLARVGPWVELVVFLLSLSLLIVYVVGILARKKQRRFVPPLTSPD
jgi:4-amino-4-deoxy-L-arabinose transferase-like glycosyltransferase